MRDEINDRTRAQVAAILDDARHRAPGSLARMVADFRSALLNQEAIEAKGIAPLAPMLARIDRAGDRLALTRLLGSAMRADVDPLDVGTYTSASLLGLSVAHSIHGEKTCSAFLLQGGLALGDRNQYLNTEARAVEQRRRYQQYIARLLTLAGFDHADQRAESVLALETAIAGTHATSQASAVDRNADNQWSQVDFAREAPGMDWAAFFEAAGLGWQPVIVAWQPSAVKGVASLVASRPLESWKDYLRFHVIHAVRRRAAARLRRGGGRHAPRRALARCARAGDHAGGHGRRHRRAVRGALLPVRPEGARARHRRQRRDGVPRARGAARRGCRRPAGRSRWPSSIGCTSASAIRKRGRTGAISASTPPTRSATRNAWPTAPIVMPWRDSSSRSTRTSGR